MPDTTSQSMSQTPEVQPKTGLLASVNSLQHWLDFGLDLLFPPRCAGCQRLDSYWCQRCQDTVNAIPLGVTVNQQSPLQAVAATAAHADKLQQALWSLKYENGKPVAPFLAQRLTAYLVQLNWRIDMIVPVPLHTSRLAQRGYNQAQLLAEGVARQTGIPCSPHALHRQRHTQSQVGLNAHERQTNMEAAFTANHHLANQTLLLIDDVLTTGATLGACAQAALDAGAQAVYGLTVTAAQA